MKHEERSEGLEFGPVLRPAPELVRQLSAVSTSTLANALDRLGVAGVMKGIVPAVTPARCLGTAITVRAVAGELGRYRADEFALGEVVENAAPGDVIVIDLGGAEVASWGGLAALAAKAKGIAGLAVDGGVRDVDEIREIGFPVFSRHVTPLSPRSRVRITGINVGVEAGGLRIDPGDVIAGDSTGMVRIPSALLGQVAEAARQLQARDEIAMQALRSGGSLLDALRVVRQTR